MPPTATEQNHAPQDECYIYSVCQQCNTNCGIKVKLSQGHINRIAGNPYSPWTLTPHIDYTTPLSETLPLEGALCPKGYAGIQTIYDPYRLKKVLKRVGKRGENRWKSIDFHEAIQEIVQGGNLFDEGQIDGLAHLASLRDSQILRQLATDAQAVAQKKLSLSDFHTKHAEHLHHFIDPNHPDLGVKNNQICYSWGRLKGGRNEFGQRFFRDGLGTINTHGHTTVCQGSLYFTCKAMSDQFHQGHFRNGKKFYWQADTNHAEFIIFVGANPLEANYGPPLRASKLSQNMVHGAQRIAVVDPRCSKTAARAWKWIPVHPHGVAALGMGMLRWILEHHKYDARYLQNCTQHAAHEDKEPTWTQAAWLVKILPDGTPGPFLRASDLGQALEKRIHHESEWLFDAFVTLQNNIPVFFDPNDQEQTIHGELFVDTQLQGQAVKSVLQIYKEAAFEKSLEQWAQEAGTTTEEIQELAKEFTAHGKKAVADIHRGASQHTNGFYTVAVWMVLNTLLGNCGWKGGLAQASTYDSSGTKAQGPYFPFAVEQEKKCVPWGLSIIRHGAEYEKSTLFNGFPAQRMWYPFASDIYQEIIPSARDSYPYQIKALFLYMAAPTYSLPAGHALMDILRDPQKIPLIVASDITVGETSLYADYIFPDASYLERWEFPGSHPSQICKVAPVRQPCVAPLTETVTVYGQDMPITWEATLLAFAEALQLPTFGPHAFGPDQHLLREEDMYLRMVANIAYGEHTDGSQKVCAASAEEIALFLQARQHLASTTFDAARWKRIVGENLWPHVVTVLNRGGRFENFAEATDHDYLRHAYTGMISIYFDNFTRIRHAMTGKTYFPHAHALPGPVDCLGHPLPDREQGYDLMLITYKSITQCKTRTAGNYWLHTIQPENFLDMAASDAARLEIKNGDTVKILSASNPQGLWNIHDTHSKAIVAKVNVIQGLRPGVVAFSLGYGHWANGAGAMTIDDVPIASDARRATGFHANAVMRLDPVLKNTGLCDTVGGSAVFYQSFVKVIKVSQSHE